MTDPAKRERAALDVLALAFRNVRPRVRGWRAGPTSYDPGTR